MIAHVPSFVSFLAVVIHGLSCLVVCCMDDHAHLAIDVRCLDIGMPVSAAYAVVFKT